jgi:hypothetical protein
MKKITLSLILAVCSLGLFAQKGEKKAKIEAMKVAFVTEKLNLTPEEAQKFWPVFNQYETERKALRESLIGKYKDDGITVDQMTPAQADELINDQLTFRTKELELTKKYVAEFKKILPSNKVAKLLSIDEQFKKYLIKQAQDMPPAPGTPPGPKGQKLPPPPPVGK